MYVPVFPCLALVMEISSHFFRLQFKKTNSFPLIKKRFAVVF